MANCDNIENTQTVTLSSGTLTSGFCHTSLQATYEEFISKTAGSLTGNMAAFTAGDDPPSAQDQNKLWLKQNASTCVPEGWHWYNGSNTAWEDVPVPETALPSSLTPVGTIIMYGASAAPTNWLICNGDPKSRTTYATLFGIIGTTYGDGDGSSTFNLPDLRSRMPVGIGDGDAGGTALTDRGLGDTGGEENVTLTESQLPAHNHWGGLFTQQGYNFTGNGIETRTSGWGGKSIDGWRGAHGTGGPQQTSTQDAGGGDAHNNLPPFLAINFIIRI